MLKAKDLVNQSESELRASVKNLDKEIFLLRGELAVQRKLEKPHQLKAKRKDKARVLTVLTQKQKGGA
jgi:large subunit ribosomal protein L29